MSIYAPPADCKVHLLAVNREEILRFSWRDVKDLATQILHECSVEEGRAGYGGIAALQRGKTWVVEVVGVDRRGGE